MASGDYFPLPNKSIREAILYRQKIVNLVMKALSFLVSQAAEPGGLCRFTIQAKRYVGYMNLRSTT